MYLIRFDILISNLICFWCICMFWHSISIMEFHFHYGVPFPLWNSIFIMKSQCRYFNQYVSTWINMYLTWIDMFLMWIDMFLPALVWFFDASGHLFDVNWHVLMWINVFWHELIHFDMNWYVSDVNWYDLGMS